jgi:membrane-bound ClpP family serine protease
MAKKTNDFDYLRVFAGLAQMALGAVLVAVPDPLPGAGPTTVIGAPIFLTGAATLASSKKK